MDWKDHIVCDPEILSGRATIKGTRISVEFLFSLFAQGWTEQTVLEEYPFLTRDQLTAAFAFIQHLLQIGEAFEDYEDMQAIERVKDDERIPWEVVRKELEEMHGSSFSSDSNEDEEAS